MNRRAFIKRFGIGVAAACALASLPETAVKALGTGLAGKRIACEYLRKLFNEHAEKHKALPLAIMVSHGLMEAFEGELLANERFCSTDSRYGPDNVLFKGRPVIPDATLSGWDVRIVADDTNGREWAMNTTGAVYA